MSQDEDRSRDRILFHLKTLGSQTAGDVGARLGMTRPARVSICSSSKRRGWWRARINAKGGDGRENIGGWRSRVTTASPTVIPI